MFKWIEIGDGDMGVWVGASERGVVTAGIGHYPESEFKFRYSVAAPDPEWPDGPYKTIMQGTRPTLDMCKEAAEMAARKYVEFKGL